MGWSKHEVVGGVHILESKNEQVKARIDRIYEDRRTGTRAEVLIQKTDAPNPHIIQSTISLTGPNAKRDLAKACGQQYDELDWTGLIENMCFMVLAKHREGEAVLNLATLEERDKVKFRIEPLIFEGQSNLFFGDGGLGKSLWAVYLASLVASGASIDPFTVEPGNVLYLDYEADEEEVRSRLQAICEGLEIEKPPFWYRYSHQSLANELETMQRIVADHGIDVIVVDSAAPACGGAPEETQSALAFFNALRSLKTTNIIIAHVSKGGGSKAGPFGSVFWKNISRTVWEIRRVQAEGDNHIEFGLWHRKINSGRLLRPLAYKIEFSPDKTVFNRMNVTESEGLSKGLTIPQQIERALTKQAMTSDELSEKLEIPIGNLRPVLSRDKRFVLVEGKFWGNAQRY